MKRIKAICYHMLFNAPQGEGGAESVEIERSVILNYLGFCYSLHRYLHRPITHADRKADEIYRNAVDPKQVSVSGLSLEH